MHNNFTQLNNIFSKINSTHLAINGFTAFQNKIDSISKAHNFLNQHLEAHKKVDAFFKAVPLYKSPIYGNSGFSKLIDNRLESQKALDTLFKAVPLYKSPIHGSNGLSKLIDNWLESQKVLNTLFKAVPLYKSPETYLGARTLSSFYKTNTYYEKALGAQKQIDSLLKAIDNVKAISNSLGATNIYESFTKTINTIEQTEEDLLENPTFEAITSELKIANENLKRDVDSGVIIDNFFLRIGRILSRVDISNFEKRLGQFILYWTAYQMLMSIIYSFTFSTEKNIPLISDPRYYESQQSLKEEIIDSIKVIINTDQNDQHYQDHFQLTLPCKVYSKPHYTSDFILSLSSGYYVSVIQRKGKWTYIMFSSPNNGLLESGWVSNLK